MKLTNKILLAMVSLILILILITSVMVVAKIEIAVTPRIEGRIERELPNHSFSEIILSRGISVNLTQSDSFSVKVQGADNFINNYLIVEQKGEKLLFLVKPGIKHYPLHAIVNISMPVLNRIVIEEPTFKYYSFIQSFKLFDFTLDKLEVNLSADGILVSVNNKIGNLTIKCSKFASAIFDSCTIKNVNYVMEDYSYARINNISGNIKGELNDNSILSFSRLEGEPEIIRSKKLMEMFTNKKEYLTGLTWGSSMEEAEEVINNNFGSKISEEYYFQKDRYKNFFPFMSNLEFEGGSLNDIPLERITLYFYRYSLYGISIFFKDTNVSIDNNYNTLLEEITKKYPSSQFSESDHKTDWKLINKNDEVETVGGIYHDKALHFFISPEKFRSQMQKEFKDKNNTYKSLKNFGKRQNELSENPIKSLLYYGLKN